MNRGGAVQQFGQIAVHQCIHADPRRIGADVDGPEQLVTAGEYRHCHGSQTQVQPFWALPLLGDKKAVISAVITANSQRRTAEHRDIFLQEPGTGPGYLRVGKPAISGVASAHDSCRYGSRHSG